MPGKNKDFHRGNAYVKEHTGSATMIDIDGKYSFEHNEKPGPVKGKEIEK